MMLTLLTFPGSDGLPSHSPFCVKAMGLLILSGQRWNVEYVHDLATMPLGRVPVLRADGRLIPDSHHIQAHLESLGAEFNPGLTPQDRARSHMLIRMVEENLRMGLVHDRWLHPDVWPILSQIFFAPVPDPGRAEIAAQARDQVQAGLISHGIAQFDEADRLARMEHDLNALTLTLGDRPYLFGARPTAADAATVPVLDMILRLPAPTGLRALAQARPSLQAYVTRARAVLYPTKLDLAPQAA